MLQSLHDSRYSLIAKWLVIIAAGVLVAIIARELGSRALVVVVAILGLGILAKVKPHHLTWLIAFTIAFRFEYEVRGVRLNWTELLSLLLLALLFFRSMLGQDSTWVSLPYKALFSIYLLTGLVSHLLGPHFEGVVQGVWHLYKTVLALPLLYLTTFASIRREKTLRIALIVLIAGFTLSALVGIVQTASGGKYLTGQGVHGNLAYLGFFPPYPSDLQAMLKNYVGKVSDVTHVPGTEIFRAHGGFGGHNYFAIGLIVSWSLTMGLMLYARSGRQKFVLGIAALLQASALVLTFSRGGWAGLVLSLLCVILLVRKKLTYGLALKSMVLAGLGIASLAIGFLLLPDPLVDRVTSIFQPSEAREMKGRFVAWDMALAGIGDHPYTGTGSAEVEGFTIFGHGATAHNIFISIAYERGLIGLIVFIFLTFFFFRDSFYLSLSPRASVSPTLRGLGVGMFVGLVGFVAAGMLGSPILYPDTGALYWFTAGLLMVGMKIKRDREMP